MSDREPGNRTLSVLDELTLSSKSLQKKWKTDNRYPEASIQKFIRLNEKAFHFIGVSAQSLCTSQGVNLRLRASQYVGIVPLLSPKTGHPIENLVLTGRYGEDIAELMPIVGAFVQPGRSLPRSEKVSLAKVCQPHTHPTVPLEQHTVGKVCRKKLCAVRSLPLSQQTQHTDYTTRRVVATSSRLVFCYPRTDVCAHADANTNGHVAKSKVPQATTPHAHRHSAPSS